MKSGALPKDDTSQEAELVKGQRELRDRDDRASVSSLCCAWNTGIVFKLDVRSSLGEYTASLASVFNHPCIRALFLTALQWSGGNPTRLWAWSCD